MSENLGENHFYAMRVIDAAEVHISEAVSGRGYTCLGCGRDMQAVKHKTHVTDFFRHDAKYVKQNNKCTFSDHQYRKHIAIDSLVLEKRIKVPAIYKFNPNNFDDPPMTLKSSDFVYATTVKRNLLFFEDASGLVAIGSELLLDNCIMLFQPDVVLFQDQQPILLVQIVKKFSISEADKANLRRLRINTLQITLPEDSREAIFQSLFQSGRSKWVYTNEQQFTNYLRPSGGNSGRSEPIDEFEKRLHTESVTCRRNQIANLIRSINKCYQSEQYREIESRVTSRLRDERRTVETYRKQRIDLEAAIREDVERHSKDELERIAISQLELDEKRNGFSEDKTDLETRYRDKVAELENDVRTLTEQREEFTRLEHAANNATKETQFAIEREERAISEHVRDTELEFSERLIELSGLTDRIAESIGRAIAGTSGIQRRKDDLPKEFEQLEIDSRQQSDGEIERICREEENLPEWARLEEIELAREFEQLRRRFDNTFTSRDRSDNTRISTTLNTLLNRRTKLADLEYVRRLIESIEKEAYKNWVR
ncbi:coiled-coil domain-containing protein [Mucilaginibacter psychrotolerans]|uniref:Uncharacterized protein n=1 Tax=Mucilaginibacter psychrotolerans TaxID=1524096 RepID=A0A4Y8SFX7_9SPHI|nr:hypothetical protein [Mucilaginibacter psychrotolerans]TFF37939.1 hypothetical protein E2R66_10140 [Mucilaginibacter psychrotolerans]